MLFYKRKGSIPLKVANLINKDRTKPPYKANKVQVVLISDENRFMGANPFLSTKLLIRIVGFKPQECGGNK